jgi:hypothetical protein
MKMENWCIVSLDERDVRLAAANGGLEVKLTAATAKVIIRVSGRCEEEPGQDNRHGNGLSYRDASSGAAQEHVQAVQTAR